jgi:hypothetical protein
MSTRTVLDGPDRNLTTAAAAASLGQAGSYKVYSIIMSNGHASSDQYVQVFDAAALPANTAVPIAFQLVPAGTSVGLSWESGRVFGLGVFVCNSSTALTKTIGTTDCLFDINYRVY